MNSENLGALALNTMLTYKPAFRINSLIRQYNNGIVLLKSPLTKDQINAFASFS